MHNDSRTGRRPKFTPDDDLVLVREVAAAKAHVAPNGATKERFETAAKKSNATHRLSCVVTWKSIQDRYKRIQTRFDERDRVESLMSGVGGDVGEMEELLSSMKEARQDFRNNRNASRKEAEDRELEKERLGAIVQAQSLSRRKSSTEIDEDGGEIRERGSSEDVTPVKRRGEKRNHRDAFLDTFADDISSFTSALKTADEARLDLEERRFNSEKEDRNREREDREHDREERRLEREENSRMELEKWKIMMDAFKNR